MQWLADKVMRRRARRLLLRLQPHLPPRGKLADIGSGTGHNAEAIRSETVLEVEEFDVADLHWTGPQPVLYDGERLPVEDGRFDGMLMLFVLQYPDSPSDLLSEVHRVARGSVIIVQSTYRGRWGRAVLALREFIWGRLAFRVARFARLFPADDCPLQPRRLYTRDELVKLFERAGFNILAIHAAAWPGFGVSRDLFVLQPSGRESPDECHPDECQPVDRWPKDRQPDDHSAGSVAPDG